MPLASLGLSETCMNTLKGESSSSMVINSKNLIEKNNIYRNENGNVTKKKICLIK